MYAYSLRRSQAGIASIWVLLSFLVVLLFIGLAIDTAYLLTVGSQLQNAADASALGGAQHLRSNYDLVRSVAVNVAAANNAAGASVQLDSANDVEIGFYDAAMDTFTPSMIQVNACRVTVRRTADSANGAVTRPFSDLIGPETTEMARSSIAAIGGTLGAGMILLNEFARDALEIQGSGEVIITDGCVQVNSNNSRAARIFGNALLDAKILNTPGAVTLQGSADITGEIIESSYAVPDPLADLPEPVWNPAMDLTPTMPSGNNITLSPGYYSGGLDFTGNKRITLLPGTYILDGSGLRMRGNAELYADGVTFYITGSGDVDLAGTGDVFVTASESGTYEGVAIFQDRANTNQAFFRGTSGMSLEGTYYFPSNHVRVQGNSEEFGTQFIADTAEIQGNGTLKINYDGRNPIPGMTVYLVR